MNDLSAIKTQPPFHYITRCKKNRYKDCQQLDANCSAIDLICNPKEKCQNMCQFFFLLKYNAISQD